MRETADILQLRLEYALTADVDLSARLERMHWPPDAIELQSLHENCDRTEETATAGSGEITPVRATTPLPKEVPEWDVPVADSRTQQTYDMILRETRVYRRVKDRDLDAVTTASTNISRTWSVLSGISMSQISVISIIHLPLYESELRSFRQLASLPAHTVCGFIYSDDLDWDGDNVRAKCLHPSSFSTKNHRGCAEEDSRDTEAFMSHYGLRWSRGTQRCGHSALRRELYDLSRDPPELCAAGPVGEDTVR